jgi:hypothetical protein
MNDDELGELFAKAREARRNTSRIEYGFETRVGARLRDEASEASWLNQAWRLCPFFAGIVLMVFVWNAPSLFEFSSDQAALARDDYQVVEYFTGEEI